MYRTFLTALLSFFIVTVTLVSGAPPFVEREARLILPKQRNDGRSLEPVRKELELKLLKAFGGFTRSEAFGDWTDGSRVYEDADWVYEIAIPLRNQARYELVQIAKWLKGAADQSSIYLRLPAGDVAFV